MKMTERFDIGGSFGISTRRTIPIRHGRIGQSGLFIVVCQEFRFHFYPLGEPTLQCFGNASMEGAPGFLGEGAVGRVLDERMLKVVGRKGYLALLEHEP